MTNLIRASTSDLFLMLRVKPLCNASTFIYFEFVYILRETDVDINVKNKFLIFTIRTKRKKENYFHFQVIKSD